MSADIYEAFRVNVQVRMDKLGLSQSDLARLMGVTPSYVCQLLNGLGNPGLTTVQEFADALGCQPHELLKNPRLEKTAK